MHTATSTEVKNRFGEYLEIARSEPVNIKKSGRYAVVMISTEEYERLTALEDYIWGQRAIEAEKSGFLSHEETMAMLREFLAEKSENE